jgi:hypothetical protein
MIDGGLRKLFRQYLPEIHWVTIETGLTEQGIPDSNFCFGGVEGWIEFKLTSTLRVPLRSEQVGWLMRRSRAGGRTFVVIRHRSVAGPIKGPARDRLIIYHGASAQDLAISGLRVPPLLECSGYPARWDWTAVKALLTLL